MTKEPLWFLLFGVVHELKTQAKFRP